MKEETRQAIDEAETRYNKYETGEAILNKFRDTLYLAIAEVKELEEQNKTFVESCKDCETHKEDVLKDRIASLEDAMRKAIENEQELYPACRKKTEYILQTELDKPTK